MILAIYATNLWDTSLDIMCMDLPHLKVRGLSLR
jgi:hypothetical protein